MAHHCGSEQRLHALTLGGEAAAQGEEPEEGQDEQREACEGHEKAVHGADGLEELQRAGRDAVDHYAGHAELKLQVGLSQGHRDADRHCKA